MKLFDILGPVMIGPSSSHTAGAVKMGLMARKLLREAPVEAQIDMYGSFIATGAGHGTDRALVAGLLGMQPDDLRIRDSFTIAKEQGLHYRFGEAQLKNAHPNTVVIHAKGKSGAEIMVQVCSLGGGRIQVQKLDGVDTVFNFEYNTLIVYNEDKPGCIAEVTAVMEKNHVNVATMHLCRSGKGGMAIMVIECDQTIPQIAADNIAALAGIVKVIPLNLKEEEENV